MQDVENKLVEIRWHGRAGQGVVTASEMLAQTALEEERYFQAFPEFGAERSGAPIRAFSRFSNKPISLHYAIYEPDVVVVFDPTLIGAVNITEGLKDNGILVINTQLEPDELRERLGLTANISVHTVDATRIAMETTRRNMPNTPMIGALLRAVSVVSKKSAIEYMHKTLTSRLGQGIADANKMAFERAFNEVRQD